MPERVKLQTSSAFASGRKVGHLRFIDLARLSIRVFRTKPTRTLLTVLGMSLGFAIVLFLISLGYGLQYLLIGRLVTTEDSLITLNAYYPTDSNVYITQKDIDKIQSSPEFQEISPVAEFPAAIVPLGGMSSSTSSGFLLARIAPFNYERLSGITPDLVKKSDNPGDDIRGVVITSAALKTLGWTADEKSLGKEIAMNVFYPVENGLKDEVHAVANNQPLTIRGIISDETQPPLVIVPQKALGDITPPYYQSVFVKTKDANGVESLRAKLLGMGLLVSSRIDVVNQVRKIMSIVTTILGVFGVTALIVSAIGMFNTMLISFMERVFEVGIMKALGATNRDIRNLFLAESFLMGLLGGVGGILLGFGMSDVANFGINLLAKTFGGKPVQVFLRPWWFGLVVAGLAAIIGVLSGFWPARRATKVSPAEAFVRK